MVPRETIIHIVAGAVLQSGIILAAVNFSARVEFVFGAAYQDAPSVAGFTERFILLYPYAWVLYSTIVFFGVVLLLKPTRHGSVVVLYLVFVNSLLSAWVALATCAIHLFHVTIRA